MCTALNYQNGVHHLFGRNLDYEIDFPVSVVITPEKYHFDWRHGGSSASHYPMIGMAMVQNNYPLYFEAINNAGLGMAGLAFVADAKFFEPVEGKTNVGSFEIVPYVLTQCSTVEEAKALLANVNITNEPFSGATPPSPLHWMIGDSTGSIVVESCADGLHVYDNPFDVLTNCPTFPFQATNVSNYINLTGNIVDIRFAKDKKGLSMFSRGMGSFGLPGGVDSVSRFVRAAWVKSNSFCNKDDVLKNVAEYFHILSSVAQLNGETEITPDEYEITQYTCCGDTSTGIFYYSTYYNPAVQAVDMTKEDLSGSSLVTIPVKKDPEIQLHN